MNKPILLVSACIALCGCREPLASGSNLCLVLTQIPAAGKSAIGKDILDVRYPCGSRVALAMPAKSSTKVRVLSEGLCAAGDPIVAPDGRTILFVGKAEPSGVWQIYEARMRGGRPRIRTAMLGGAMAPALRADGGLVFASPVPCTKKTPVAHPPELFVQPCGGGVPRQITFATTGVSESTVLADGRILFVAANPSAAASGNSHFALYTVNNDGTEITAFAAQHEGADCLRRPRELCDGRIAFLTAESSASARNWWAETVRTARPFSSRSGLVPELFTNCLSVEAVGDGSLLVSLERHRIAARSGRSTYAIFQVQPNATVLREPVFDDPAWDDIEAMKVAPRAKPMGHLSRVDSKKKTGLMLCLDVHRTTDQAMQPGTASVVERIRVLSKSAEGSDCALGQVSVHADGSFLVEVPSDVPLGFEALDAKGNILRRLPPMIWVRPGENRSCLGCHEPHGRSPRNHRPLAARYPPISAVAPAATSAQKNAQR